MRLSLLLHDVVCIMCIIGYIGSTSWLLRLMDKEVDVGLNLTMCIEIEDWIWKLSWIRSLDNCLVGLGKGTRKAQTRFVCNICHVPGRWRINPILKKFLALDWTSFRKEPTHSACTRPVCWWFCHQLNFLKGCSGYFVAMIILKLLNFQFPQFRLFFNFKTLFSNAQLFLMLFLKFLPFESW